MIYNDIYIFIHIWLYLHIPNTCPQHSRLFAASAPGFGPFKGCPAVAALRDLRQPAVPVKGCEKAMGNTWKSIGKIWGNMENYGK
jgi:hypothetical protein